MNIIRNKIDKFIRKYYTNQILTGFILLTGILLLLLLVSVLIEYFAWMNVTGRKILFWSVIGICAIIFIYFILLPLLRMLRLGKVISYRQAANIIGKYFPDIKDKLLNYLELEQMQDTSLDNNDLIVASINQKTDNLSPFNFSKAVSFKSALKYLKYVAPIILVFLAVLIAKPSFIKQPAERIINYNTEYEKPLPFHFVLKNEDLNVIQNKDYTVYFYTVGDKKPDNVTINFNNGKKSNISSTYMTKENDSLFSYTFKSLHDNLKFYASSEDITSNTYEVNVFPQPALLGFNLDLHYPKYTNKQDETIENTGIIKILYGTVGDWDFSTKDADGLVVIKGSGKDTLRNDNRKKSDHFTMSSRFSYDDEISIVAFNEHLFSKDTLKYTIQIINDLSPDIQVMEARDSLMNRDFFFSGTISDDYGFSSLKFYYRIIQDDNSGNYQSMDVPFDKQNTMQRFYWRTSINELGILPGESIEYYFEVCDNDEARGHKCSTTQVMSFRRMNADEMDEMSEKMSEEFKENLDNSMDKINDIQQQIDDFLRELKEKENLTFQDKEKLENMLQEQQKLIENMERQQEELQINNYNQNQYNEFSESILDKQQKLEELYDKILTEDMKKMLEDMQKMLENFNKDNLDSQLREFEQSYEDLEKQLDQTLELYKNIEFQQEFEKTMSDLDSLANKQMELSEKTKEADKDDLEGIGKEQEKLNEEFDKVMEDLKKLDEMNEKLEEKFDIDFDDPEIDDIKKEMQEASDKLGKKKKDASKNQDNAGNKMKNMAQKMQQQFDDSMFAQAAEDEESVRRLLQNVVHLSFSEEQLIDELKKVKVGNPKYVEIIHKQNDINKQLAMTEDTLTAIAKRNFQISQFIFNELKELKDVSKQATTSLTNRNVSQASKNLQQTMSSLNKFALMISESLDEMEQQMSNMSSCSNGKNPKSGNGGKASMQTMKDLQEQLKKQMEEMKENQGKSKNSGKEGQMGNSEQFAKMAMEQEAIRRQLEQLQQELRSEGQGLDGDLQKAIDAMEQNEIDLINKRLTDEMMKRQEEIMTRLLQSEKAQKQREQDNQRQSKEGKVFDRPSPEEIFNPENKGDKFDDKLHTVPPSLNNFYRQRVDKYRYELKKQ